MDFDWKKIVKTVAPTLATALGGPLAGMAITAICEAVGIEGADADTVQAKETKIAEILASPNPEVLLKLKESDNAFKLQLKKLDIDLEKIAADDRASARQRQVALKDDTPALLSMILTLGFFGALAAHIFWDVPVANQSLLNVMLGSLGTAWIAAMTYFFGSSAGSRSKEIALNDALKKEAK